MGSDYFTLGEIREITGISDSVLYRKKNLPGSFVAHKVGSKKRGRWVVNKRQFFKWYARAINDGTFQALFGLTNHNDDSIQSAMRKYYADLADDIERKRAVSANRLYRKQLKGVTVDEYLRKQRKHARINQDVP